MKEELRKIRERISRGGKTKYHQRLREQNKLFVRERIRLLLDQGDKFQEEGRLASCQDKELPAEGVITGSGRIDGREVCLMANDSTVKAGSWGAKTVSKILKIQRRAARLKLPLFYLVDSAGARITDQIKMFPGRQHAGRIFYNQVNLSGVVPQICLLFGPSAAGGAYIPAFCDLVIMVRGRASMYLGSPRMAEMVIGEKVSLEEMGGAEMHCTESGCGDLLVDSEEEALACARKYFSYFPSCHDQRPKKIEGQPPAADDEIASLIPEHQNQLFDMYTLLDNIIDARSGLEIKENFAPELITMLARIDGRPVGILANQPLKKGGVLFSDSADKGTRFIRLCNAFNIPLIFLADVPGFMIGTMVEKRGIIRHGAKMISAVSMATVPKLSIIIRKAYGAGLYAMAGPAFEPDLCLALPSAQIAVMGPEAAVNAVYGRKIKEMDEGERKEFIDQKRREYQENIDIYRLASELIIDDIIAADEIRSSLIEALKVTENKEQKMMPRRNGVTPV